MRFFFLGNNFLAPQKEGFSLVFSRGPHTNLDETLVKTLVISFDWKQNPLAMANSAMAAMGHFFQNQNATDVSCAGKSSIDQCWEILMALEINYRSAMEFTISGNGVTNML